MIYRLCFTGPRLRTSVDQLPEAEKCMTSLLPVSLLFLCGKNEQPVLRRTFLCTPLLSASVRRRWAVFVHVSYVMFNYSLTIKINWTALVPLWCWWLFIISACSIYHRNWNLELGIVSHMTWQSSTCVAEKEDGCICLHQNTTATTYFHKRWRWFLKHTLFIVSERIVDL